MCDTCDSLRRELREAREELVEYRASLRRNVTVQGDEDRVARWIDALGITVRQARCLIAMTDAPERIMSRAALQPLVCVPDAPMAGTFERAVDGNIKRLRRRLEARLGRRSWITAVYGLGYRLDTDAARILRIAVGEASPC